MTSAGGVRWCSLLADGAGKDGMGMSRRVGPCCRPLMVFPWVGAHCTGVVVVHVTAMRATVVSVVKTLD